MEEGRDMEKNKRDVLEKLIGIRSSKRSYYVELKETVSEVTKQNVQLDIINQLVRSITINMSLEDIMNEVISKLKKVIYFDQVALFSLSNDALILTDVFPDTPTQLKQGEKIPHSQSLYWSSIFRKKPIQHFISEVPDFFEDSILRNMGIKTVLVFPLIIQNQPIGVLTVGSTRKRMDYSKHDINFLSQVADQLAVCIDNASIYRAMSVMRAELEELFEAVTDMLIHVDLDSCNC